LQHNFSPNKKARSTNGNAPFYGKFPVLLGVPTELAAGLEAKKSSAKIA
jgi:hypothetical protein